MMKQVILTGIRSNDEPTLGNYIGAFLPMVRMQHEKSDEYQVNMFVPDLHSFTTPINHSELYQNTFKNLKYFIAAGLDINNPNTYIYRQSFIPAHSELTWILDCFTYFGELSRMTQFKEKSALSDNVSAGLFNYPVLMAADILLYDALWVPVGDDQKQHLELARDIAIRFNNKFGEVFTVPKTWKNQLEFSDLETGVRIRSLSNPQKKMSKSINDPKGTILLSDSPTQAVKKIIAAETDNVGKINFDWVDQPGVSNLLQILALLSARDQAHVNAEWEGRNKYGDLKSAVAKVVEEFLSDFQKIYSLIDDDTVNKKLMTDEELMQNIANKKLHKVQKAVGLRQEA